MFVVLNCIFSKETNNWKKLFVKDPGDQGKFGKLDQSPVYIFGGTPTFDVNKLVSLSRI